MREIRTEIDINAPAAKVWQTLMDFNGWANWNPIVNAANGNAAKGSKLDITMKGDNGKDGPKYQATITQFENSKLFRWRAKMMGGIMMTNDKVFELESTPAGTHLVHKELFSGIMPGLMWGKLNKFVPAMLDSMNSALKDLTENN